jgi:hypothetical protein
MLDGVMLTAVRCRACGGRPRDAGLAAYEEAIADAAAWLIGDDDWTALIQ